MFFTFLVDFWFTCRIAIFRAQYTQPYIFLRTVNVEHFKVLKQSLQTVLLLIFFVSAFTLYFFELAVWFIIPLRNYNCFNYKYVISYKKLKYKHTSMCRWWIIFFYDEQHVMKGSSLTWCTYTQSHYITCDKYKTYYWYSY